MKMTKRDQIILAVVAVVAVVGGFYWFAIKPAKAELSAQQQQLTQIQAESSTLKDTLARAASATKSNARLAADRLRLAKALPVDVETPSVVVQLQRLADRANVQLTSIQTNNYSDYGSIRATEFEVRVTGKYFDVDDFLYRLHGQVTVDAKDKPIISGRLFATTSVDLTLDQGDQTTTGGLKGDDIVVGTIKVLAFSSVPAGAAAAAAPAATPPATTGSTAAAPAATTGQTTTGQPTTAAPAAGAPQTTATPSSGGAQ